MSRPKLYIFRLIYITLGLATCAYGIDMSVKAGLGVSPWTVFHLGIARHIGFTQGQVSQLVGISIILVSFLLGIKPNVGTIMNMLLIGWFYDFYVWIGLIPQASSLPVSIAYVLVSAVLTGFGAAMYMSAGLGAGPRDSLMLALTTRTGWMVGRIRTTMELTVLVAGWLLGGPVGLGTVLFSLGIGPVVQRSFELIRKVSSLNAIASQVVVIPLVRRKQPQVPGAQA